MKEPIFQPSDTAGVGTPNRPFATLGGDYTLSQSSPCLPANNSWGVQVGVYGQGCGSVSLEQESWGKIKTRYR